MFRLPKLMSDWMPSLNTLRAFEAVSRHLSYSKAAEELSVTRGAVKQMVAKLEQSLGAKLVARNGQHLGLTSVGEAAQYDLRLGMKHLRKSVQTVRRRDQSHRVIVTAEASLASTWLVPQLARFWEQHPDIDILVDSSQNIVDLTVSDCDVAIRYGVSNPKNDFFIERLFEDMVCPACSPALVDGPPKLRNIDQLKDVPLLHWDMSNMSWAQETRRWFTWEEWQKRAGVSLSDVSKGRRFSDYAMAVNAAIAGQGVVLAGLPILRDLVNQGVLVIPFPDKTMRTDIGFDLVTTPSAQERPEVALFIDWLLTTAKGYRTTAA